MWSRSLSPTSEYSSGYVQIVCSPRIKRNLTHIFLNIKIISSKLENVILMLQKIRVFIIAYFFIQRKNSIVCFYFLNRLIKKKIFEYLKLLIFFSRNWLMMVSWAFLCSRLYSERTLLFSFGFFLTVRRLLPWIKWIS